MPAALLSVSDKTGLVPFAEGLQALGYTLLSTGGTAKALRTAGLAVTDVADVTRFPEMLDGRVKTLHPAVHGGLLARRDLPEHMAAIAAHGIAPIDLVCVNLYPFVRTAETPGIAPDEVIEQIDIGGPSMLRSAAKNFAAVTVVVDPTDYARVLDALIAGWFAAQRGERFPERLTLAFERAQPLRYGENPDQGAAFYVERRGSGLGALRQHGGKELSFNNLLDLEGAMLAVAPFTGETACAIVKHTTPCGLAVAPTPVEAYRKALACDPVSAFGSIIAFSQPVDLAAAEAVAQLFVECVVAPAYTLEALAALGAKKNLRILEGSAAEIVPTLDVKGVRGGILVQERATPPLDEGAWTVVSRRPPTTAERADLAFAWRAVASVKSNAIVLARDGATLGIGAGQMSRVDAAFLAAHKARAAGHETRGSALGSDAFFPFADGVEQAAAAGVTAIIQPGGSVRDAEVIAAADAHDIAMIFTGRRTFRH